MGCNPGRRPLFTACFRSSTPEQIDIQVRAVLRRVSSLTPVKPKRWRTRSRGTAASSIRTSRIAATDFPNMTSASEGPDNFLKVDVRFGLKIAQFST